MTDEQFTCPGANVVLATPGLPRCAGVASLMASGEPIAVLATPRKTGSTQRAYEETIPAAEAHDRRAIMVTPLVEVADPAEPGWKASVHDRDAERVVDADTIRSVAGIGVVPVIGVDSARCVDHDGRRVVNVSTRSLADLLLGSVGGVANVCSSDCPNFQSDAGC